MPIEQLIEGYKRYRKTRYKEQYDLYHKLHHEGQQPPFLLVSCCDSRVDPATILDTPPGQLFVVRNVANLVPPFTPDGGHHGTSAALEFGVTSLEVEHIVIMGHAQCGGAKALLETDVIKPEPDDFILNWMNLAKEARARVITAQGKTISEDLQREMEYELVRFSLRNLMTFKWIKERVEAGKLSLHGWHFGIERGILHMLNQNTGDFEPVEVDLEG